MAAFVCFHESHVFRLNAECINDADLLETAKEEYKDYLTRQIAEGDVLVSVRWKSSRDNVAGAGKKFSTMGVVSLMGEPIFEPVADLLVIPEQDGDDAKSHRALEDFENFWLDERSNFGDEATTLGRQLAPLESFSESFVARNLFGSVVVRASLSLEAVGVQNCQAAAYFPKWTTETVGLWTVSPANADPTIVEFCCPKMDCTCRGMANQTECARASQEYKFTLEVVSQWFGVGLQSFSGTLMAQTCNGE